jgi:GDP-L-fucose synthase
MGFLTDRSSKVFVAGHRGLVGSAITRALEKSGFNHILTRTRQELDLLDQRAVHAFFDAERPDYVFVAAARVGGIHANNSKPADFLYENLVLETNLLHAAFQARVRKLLFLGSSCIYPKFAPQPIREESLLTGPLEPTNEPYAIAKIAGLKLCSYYRRQYGADFISAMPTNMYGPNDNFHPTDSHVIPGMMRRFHEAKAAGTKSVTVWGTGKPLREFMHSDDLASALLLLMERYSEESTINIGTGQECTIAELAQTMKETVGFAGTLEFDPTKPDGTPRKVMDSSRLRALGWNPKISLAEGLKHAYAWALEAKKF